MLLGLSFAIAALFYASVGFGGGSSYLALLVLWEVPYRLIPIIALICNITVVSGNSFHYVRAGYLNWRLLLPPTLASIPMAYIGGQIPIEKEMFIFILFLTLLIAGVRMLINYRRYNNDVDSYKPMPIWLGILVGTILGFMSGVVGIGGGIFLAPVLYNLRAGPPKQIATTTSLFILVNSIAGLAGQLQKNGVTESIFDYWYLPLLVLIGGQLGSLMTVKIIPPRIVALLTALLVIFVSGRLGWISFFQY
ncbi:MAG: sulfite exporter TauE/SafE family protein [bacterium]|nr:sulfite exporter TauE/SafE family protein [bacterium]